MATTNPKTPGKVPPKLEYNPYLQITDFLHFGPHNPLFLEREKLCWDFIKQFKPEKVNKTLYQHGIAKGVMKSVDLSKIEPWWKYGGNKFAHLHYKDDVYLLNDEQWKTFSQQIMTTFNTIMTKAGTINFQQALKISEVISKEIMK
ncbi:MAG: hypothetical protein NTX61_03840 [Bacteroidetes bacterium]|nr:hypothetical protein [Bacteroidota bacterium]